MRRKLEIVRHCYELNPWSEAITHGGVTSSLNDFHQRSIPMKVHGHFCRELSAEFHREVEDPTGRKRVLSPAARKRIAAAQKKRWAAFKRQKAEGDKPEVERKPDQQNPRRTMSAAARKRIGDATRKRWAARRKAA